VVAPAPAGRLHEPPLQDLRVRRYPDFVEVVTGPCNGDDGAVAADPPSPHRISLRGVFKPGGSSALRVRFGSGQSASVHLFWVGRTCFVFSMKTTFEFLRWATT